VVDLVISRWPLIIQIVFGFSLLGIAWVYLPLLWGAPWVGTSRRVVGKMLRMADLKPGQTVVDLGAGDGRIVIAAARSFGAQAVGVEIDPLRCLLANMLIALRGLRGRARVRWGNMFDFDLSDADVVTLYLWPSTNQRLARKLRDELRPGARVVSHHFSVANWIFADVDQRDRVFVYEIGKTDLDICAMLAQKGV